MNKFFTLSVVISCLVFTSFASEQSILKKDDCRLDRYYPYIKNFEVSFWNDLEVLFFNAKILNYTNEFFNASAYVIVNKYFANDIIFSFPLASPTNITGKDQLVSSFVLSRLTNNWGELHTTNGVVIECLDNNKFEVVKHDLAYVRGPGKVNIIVGKKTFHIVRTGKEDDDYLIKYMRFDVIGLPSIVDNSPFWLPFP